MKMKPITIGVTGALIINSTKFEKISSILHSSRGSANRDIYIGCLSSLGFLDISS
jgi:hypothetical protein